MKGNRNPKTKSGGKPTLTPAKARVEGWKNLIVSLYLQGHTQAQVAELAREQTGGHNFTRHTVAKYVNEAIDEWKEHKSQLVDNHKAIELAKINALETTYWDAWRRSCEIVKNTSKTKKKGDEGGRMAVAQVKEDHKQGAGDPQYLRGIQWCVEMRCKILGIEVPQVAVQVNNTNNNSTSTTVIRRVVFKTRETSAAPQIITQQNAD